MGQTQRAADIASGTVDQLGCHSQTAAQSVDNLGDRSRQKEHSYC